MPFATHDQADKKCGNIPEMVYLFIPEMFFYDLMAASRNDT